MINVRLLLTLSLWHHHVHVRILIAPRVDARYDALDAEGRVLQRARERDDAAAGPQARRRALRKLRQRDDTCSLRSLVDKRPPKPC